MFSNWLLQCIENIPTKSNSCMICCRGYTKMFQPLNKIFCYISNGNFMVMSIIIVLCNSIRPFAIVRRIITIIIHSVKACFNKRFYSYIGKEIFKRFPAFTNFNSTTTIIFKSLPFRIFTSHSHSNPCSIFRSFIHTMFGHGFSRNFPIKTLTTFYMPIFKMTCHCFDCITTVAKAEPICCTVMGYVRKLFNNKSSKPLSRKVMESWHDNNIHEKYSFVNRRVDSII